MQNSNIKLTFRFFLSLSLFQVKFAEDFIDKCPVVLAGMPIAARLNEFDSSSLWNIYYYTKSTYKLILIFDSVR